ncbi:hypothetical protein M6D81_00305 [Paenibacillus sp. J5C_2022]|uniref:hypothetical protein n=1 Tax=Paenibacillus sp. J5C2022 TaxID=2977129 RepID=UPI0021D22D4F|nr:hypothetical protein [Paenibacillus sp. J5C2022]MCU6707132.1 hypothetical protein [Paenibacillus sp. J5C2022]
MLDKRSLLIGLGAGIIIGATLFQLFSIGQSNQEQLDRVGIEQPAEEGIPSPEPQDGNMPSEASGAAPSNQDEPADEELPTEKQPANETANVENMIEADKAEEATADSVTAITADERVIRIEPGFNLTETANLLASSGAIDNAAAFIKEMKKQNKMVRAGYFLFSEGTGIKDAVKIVTSEPLSPKMAQQLLLDSDS